MLSIPAGSFNQLTNGKKKGSYVYEGTIGGVMLQVLIEPLGNSQYELLVDGSGVDLVSIPTPVTVALSIGDNVGALQVAADFQ